MSGSAWFSASPSETGKDYSQLSGKAPDGLIAGHINYPESWDTTSCKGYFGVYDWAAVRESDGRCWLMFRQSEKKPDLRTLTPASFSNKPDNSDKFRLTSPFHTGLTKAEYLAALDRIHQHLLCGDCYQINFTQYFSATYSGNPWIAYQDLCKHINAQYCCYIDSGEQQILSFSPELFIEVRNRQVITKPIKGTRPRGADSREDKALADGLRASGKDRAENVMIVDLLRNDLGKVCQTGSVQVPRLFEVEHIPYAHHLVSTVTGQLADGVSSLEALLSCFPGGSITGAPKTIAMKIIDSLEKRPRGPYCGSSFYWIPDSYLTSNIAIRTFYTERDRLIGHAGGGIVMESNPEDEFKESLTKISTFIQALEQSFLD